MRTVRRIFRNTALILGADTLRLLIAFALTPVIARGLGSGGLGVYAYVMSLVSILGVVTDFGLSPYYIRTAQRHDYPPPGSATLGLRLAISLTAAAALALYAWRWAEATLRVPLLLGSLILVLGVLPAHVTALLRARERMTFDAVVRISGAVITTGGGIVAILRGWGVPGVMGALVVGGALLTALAWRTFRREEPTLTLGAPAQVYREILRGAWPFAALAILGVVYFRIDAVMLFTMRGRDTAGQYAAAYRLMEAALLVPLTLAGAAFPAMARYMAERQDEVLAISGRALHLLALVAVPAAVFGAALAPQLFAALYGPGFADAAVIFRLLTPTLVAVFASAVTSNLIAVRQPSVNTSIATLMVVVNITLNLLLIPQWGGAGAAVATVTTEGLGLVIGAWYIRQHIGPLHVRDALAKPASAALLVAAVIWLHPILAAVPLYATAYLGLLALIGGVDREDAAFLRRLVGSGSIALQAGIKS